MEAIETRTVEAGGRTYRISVFPDSDAECPSEWEGWRLVSFSHRHRSYEAPERYCKGLDEAGYPLPAHIGLSRMLDTGTAFWLSYYEHGLCRWSLMGEGPYCRWDSTRVAGILLWERPPPELPSGYQPREADARRFLDIYTDWANGQVYGYDIEILTSCASCGSEQAGLVESCFGIYGLETALSEAEAQLQPPSKE
ncbi:hypothetical protein [Tautonia rosea]|uniref:hypothetical protein n=1 Tax=Tautonia rosea TaxID=2728037 RepID=UPI001473DA1B|nr:hypothetical protein [Tautonia rosea]